MCSAHQLILIHGPLSLLRRPFGRTVPTLSQFGEERTVACLRAAELRPTNNSSARRTPRRSKFHNLSLCESVFAGLLV
jgi:hypothetical protein